MKIESAEPISLLEARFEAQKIAFGPLIFQAARLLRELGILEALRAAPAGLALEEIVARVDTSGYGVLVLLEAGLAAGLVRAQGSRFLLTTTGACILKDELTRINMDFVQQGCFQAMYYLEDSIRQGEPAGLRKVFGEWDTIYQALPALPEAVRASWLRWDHYYSDAAFAQALPVVFEGSPRALLDVGGNTGKWAIRCAQHSPDVSITILDLPGQVAAAKQNVERLGLQARINAKAIDLLDHTQPFPAGFDAIWMSQFLVCFSEADVLHLLQRAAAAMRPDSILYILDTFWDRQEHEVASFCLQAISLYFTCLANGNSRMYKFSEIAALVEAAGLKIESVSGTLGICSSLLACRRR
ncbi:MAG TPA: class I SAM-dependent methyltransferase [Burkholderiales bacterium]|nr:class I SAM-dependent methyltransferase [Burkholderiales bacterium]